MILCILKDFVLSLKPPFLYLLFFFLQILINACCPGWVRTEIAAPGAPKSPDEGAITPVYLALLAPGATEPHGKYVSDKEVQPW